MDEIKIDRRVWIIYPEVTTESFRLVINEGNLKGALVNNNDDSSWFRYK